MADAPVVHIGENSPEQVAYKLLLCIAADEDKMPREGFVERADRKWLLDTYAECLKAVKGHRLVSTPPRPGDERLSAYRGVDEE